ncbi:MAG: glycerate kinase [Pseudomonadota bacterium]
MNILIACDKFRGSLTAKEANAAIIEALEGSRLASRARPTAIPIADGGEGTLAALASHDSVIMKAPARDPFGAWHEAEWLHDRANGRAIIEMAQVAGHSCAQTEGYDPDRASSAGVGDLIKAALDQQIDKVVVSLGGSITVDGGAGALEALGARFLDGDGKVVQNAVGRALARVDAVDLTNLDPRAAGLSIIAAADVDHPLSGPGGAAAVFGPQKGVASGDIAAFDRALTQFDAAVAHACGRPVYADEPFAGAAGGMLVGLSAIAPTKGIDGFALVTAHHNLDGLIDEADLLVTGEGSLDQQSLGGKGPVAIARAARAANVPAIAFAGRLAASPAALRAEGIGAAFSISNGPQSLEEALSNAGPALISAATHAFNAMDLLASAGPHD